jgi:hypothetical protein
MQYLLKIAPACESLYLAHVSHQFTSNISQCAWFNEWNSMYISLQLSAVRPEAEFSTHGGRVDWSENLVSCVKVADAFAQVFDLYGYHS